MTSQPSFYSDTAEWWERALYAVLSEKERRSGSRRTVEGYSRMLQHFFGRAAKPPDKVASQEVFAWAHGKGLSGREPSQVTIGARMACLSSFDRFLIRMEIVSSNPCDALERPRISVSPPKGLSAGEIRRLLEVVPETRTGFRDRALIITLALTGRRRAEVLGLRRGLLSKSFILITFTGRRSGRSHTIPVNYVRDRSVLLVVSYRNRTWWRNLRGGVPVTVGVEGQDLTGIGDAIADDKEAVAAALSSYLHKAPRYAKYFGVSLDADGEPIPEEVARAAEGRVIVRIQLDQAIQGRSTHAHTRQHRLAGGTS